MPVQLDQLQDRFQADLKTMLSGCNLSGSGVTLLQSVALSMAMASDLYNCKYLFVEAEPTFMSWNLADSLRYFIGKPLSMSSLYDYPSMSSVWKAGLTPLRMRRHLQFWLTLRASCQTHLVDFRESVHSSSRDRYSIITNAASRFPFVVKQNQVERSIPMDEFRHSNAFVQFQSIKQIGRKEGRIGVTYDCIFHPSRLARLINSR